MFSFLKSLFGGEKTDLLPILEKGALILDVRNPNEFAGGHVKKAVNIPLPVVASNINKIRTRARNKPVIAYCRSGARSGRAVSILKSHGIEAYNGGGWGEMERLVANL
ncbi:MAG TPA: rhodanese-like domain-containing protein [Bacteroidetes bacterium]|nr:rhodanese-like domain-containing protein [Bacteroidota bacterium]